MRRMICFALFGLLVSSEAAFSQAQHWMRPRGRVVVVGPRFRAHLGISPRHHYFDPFRYFVLDFTPPYSAYESIVPFSPTYFFLPSESASHPQLIFKDGTRIPLIRADMSGLDAFLGHLAEQMKHARSSPNG